ncbi:hypothetical protein KSS87_020117 [Heliosperma pusillum]|nr:hypothetical protein KSS87_020117 [Heliosperma pusillum]
MNCVQEWPEPIVRVQSLADSGLNSIPDRYVKPVTERPEVEPITIDGVDIPLIDLAGLFSSDLDVVQVTKAKVAEACQEWGFFQAINHGVEPGLMDQARQAWREFFHLPMERKQKYANTPCTYEGYGSRLGVEKGAVLDWSDYYFLHFLPPPLKDFNKWPDQPPNHREIMDEYLKELVTLSGRLMKVLSSNLGLEENYLQNAFGGADVGACLRSNFYPKCPQPDLTLGLSSHSDPGGMTILLPDNNVPGLQVRKDNKWITVKPAPHAFIVNMGDQIQWTGQQYELARPDPVRPASPPPSRLPHLARPAQSLPFEPPFLQGPPSPPPPPPRAGSGLPHLARLARIVDQPYWLVLSNARYKSVEHRVIVNPNLERVSLAFFYNPRGDLLIEPAKELVTPENPAMYPSMTFNEYRLYIRLKGPRGKSQVESLRSPR